MRNKYQFTTYLIISIIILPLCLTACSVSDTGGYDDDDVTVSGIDLQWLARSESTAEYSWKVTLENNTDDEKKVYAKFNLYDEEGFVLDWTYDYIYLDPDENKTYSDTATIDNDLADKVTDYDCEITVYDVD